MHKTELSAMRNYAYRLAG